MIYVFEIGLCLYLAKFFHKCRLQVVGLVCQTFYLHLNILVCGMYGTVLRLNITIFVKFLCFLYRFCYYLPSGLKRQV